MQTFEATKSKIRFNTERPHPRAAEITKHTIPLKVRRFFTDVDGAIIDKAAAPVNLQTKYPVMMFGGFDLDGGYKTALQTVPPDPNTKYLGTFIYGLNCAYNSITGFSGLNDVKGQIKTGDIVHVFTDDLDNPNYFVWIVLSCTTAASFASIISNLKTLQNDERIGSIFIDTIAFYSNNFEQWYTPLNYMRVDNIGNYNNNPIQPLMFRNPLTEQQGFIVIETEFLLNQYLGINTYIEFDTNEMSFDFKLTKIN